MAEEINFKKLTEAQKALDSLDIDSMLATPDTPADSGRKKDLPTDQRAQLRDAVAQATGGAQDEHEADASPDTQGGFAADAEALAAASGAQLDAQARAALGNINQDIGALAAAVSAASPEEQEAMRKVILDPAGQHTIPASPQVLKVQGILAKISEAAQVIETPHAMRGYGKLMYARPAAETGKLFLEAGILSLLGTSLLQAFGVPVEPYSALHAATYVASAGGVGGINLVTISDRILRPAAEGSPSPLVKHPGSKRISLLRTSSTVGRAALLGVSVVAGIGVAEKTISTTYESSRIAGGVSAPLDSFATKKNQFERQLAAFAKVPDKVLEIAGKIETGKDTGGGKFVQWPDTEKKALIDELRPLFKDAGLDPSLVDRMTFSAPKDLGYGKAAKLKAALRTGNITDLPDIKTYSAESIAKLDKLVGKRSTMGEYVTAIRAKMGLSGTQTFEDRTSNLIGAFFATDTFSNVNVNLSKAQRMASIIRRQGEDVIATGERAFLHGAAPIGAEAVIPFARAIVDARDQVNQAANEGVIKANKQMFATMHEALQVAGASVDLPTPEVNFDTSDVEKLSQFLEEIVSSKAKSEATTSAARTAFAQVAETFVPGGKKWENTRQWLAVNLLQSAGYFVALEGDKLHIYESLRKPPTKDAVDFSLTQAVGRYYDEWKRYIFGEKPPEEWQLKKPDVDKMSDKEFGVQARDKIEGLATGQTKMVINDDVRLADLSPSTLTDEQVGAIARDQIDTQHALGKKPIVIPRGVWESIQKGVPPPSLSKLDPNEWRELSAEDAKKLMSRFEGAASWRASLYLYGGVGSLILGVMLLSLYPVYRLNKKLRSAAPDFEEELKQAEDAIAGALGSVNDCLAALPGFENLPRMDTEMFRAAIRLAGEETHPAELAESPSGSTQIWHTVKEAFSRGPYAYRVEQVHAFGELIERLQTDTAMQRRLMDIIAPGASSAEARAASLPPASTTPAERKKLKTLSMFQDMHPATAEVFRNALRGNLRFRISVLDARKEALGQIEASRTATEISEIDTQLGTLKPMLARLDDDDLFYRMTTEYREPLSRSSRALAQDRADGKPYISVHIDPDALPRKTFSVSAGIMADVARRYPDTTASVTP